MPSLASPAARPLARSGRCLAAAAAFLLVGHRAAAEPSAGAVAIGEYSGPRATLFAIDDYSLPLKQALCYYLSKPAVRTEPVLTPSRNHPHATDGVATAFYGTVLQDGGKFRMWYYGLGWAKTLPADAKDSEWSENLHEGPVCYAESVDGIHWTKPNLGQVEFQGGRDNNALALPDSTTEGAFVIKDGSDPDPRRRYKMVYECTVHIPGITVKTATSPDGIVWTGTGVAVVAAEPSSFYQFNGYYIVTAQNLAHFGEGGHRSGRQGFAWISPDFRRWLPQAGESFLLPEPLDPSERGGDRPYVQVHLGVGAASFGNVMVGLYCQWHARPNPGDWFGSGTTYGDFGLVVSNDGQHFREPVKGHVFLNRHDSPPTRVLARPDVRYEEVLTQAGNGILNVGDETRIYHGRWMNAEKDKDYYIEVALATLPRDRWGALGLFPPAEVGSVWSAPLTLGPGGAAVALNAQGIRGMKVEVADERFNLLPDYSGANAGTAGAGDGLASAVRWPRGDLAALAGQRLRLLVTLQRGNYPEPRLYAVYLAGK